MGARTVTEHQNGGAHGSLGLKELVGIALRRWKLITLIMFGVMGTAVIAAFTLTPKWKATAHLMVELSRRSAIDLDPQSATAQAEQAIIDTEVDLMNSREVARRVVEKLKLDRDPEFNRGAGKDASADDRFQKTVDATLKNVEVERQAATYLVNLSFRSISPTKAARIANSFAQEYVASRVENRVGTAQIDSANIQSRLGELGREVQTAESQVAEYRVRAGIVDGGTNGTITDQQVAPLSAQLATAEARAATARSEAAAARAQIKRGNYDSVSEVLNSAVIADLRRQRAEVLRRQGEISARYGPKHNETTSLADQLQGLDLQLRDEANRTISGLESEAASAEGSAQSLRQDLARLRSQQEGNTRAAVTAGSLEREAEAKRNVYNQLAQAAQETSQKRQTTGTLARIVDQAEPPTAPSFPNKPLIVAISFLLGIIITLVVITVLELLTKKILSGNDIERQLNATFLGSIKRLSRREGGGFPGTYIVEKPMSSYSESIRRVRTEITATESRRPLVVAVTSALPEEGKSTTALAIARIMAMSGDKVVLIDCDLRNDAGRVIPHNDQPGLVEVIERSATLDQALRHDPLTELRILQPTQAHFTPRDVFGRPEMASLLQELGATFDFIVLNTPPVLVVSEARTIVGYADKVIFLVRWNKTSSLAARAALDQVDFATRRDAFGMVLSMAESQLGSSDPTDPVSYEKHYARYYRN